MRSSTFAVVSDRRLRLRAKSKRNTTVVCSRLCADARGIQNRGKRKPERRVPNATFDNLLCHTAECSPSIALAQCALGCKPQMCGRLLQKGATKTKRAYRTTHAHHRGEIRPESRPKAQPGMAGAIAGRLGRVCLAYSARYPRLPVEECGGRGAAFGDLAQIEASSCGSRSDRGLRRLTRRVDCTHFRPWPTMGT